MKGDNISPVVPTVEVETLRIIEFFSGIGGMRCAVEGLKRKCGLSSRRLLCRAYDISLEANAVYRANFSESSVQNQQDPTCTKLVEQLKAEDIPVADLWTMSPPCQPFTRTRHAHQRDLDDKRTAGMQALFRLLCNLSPEQRPRWIFLENVKGFVTSQARSFVHDHLLRANYSWKEYVLSPVDVGIPNQRTRYYILAEQSDRFFQRSTDSFPPICHYLPHSIDRPRQHLRAFVDMTLDQDSPRWKEYVLSDEILGQEWARDLPIVSVHQDYPITYCFTSGYSRQLHKSTGSLLHVPVGKEDLNTNNEKDKATKAPVSDVTKEDSYLTRYSNQVRRFTPEELLSLFGFPSDFCFPDSTSLQHRYRLIGNSVNVFVVACLMEELLLWNESS